MFLSDISENVSKLIFERDILVNVECIFISSNIKYAKANVIKYTKLYNQYL